MVADHLGGVGRSKSPWVSDPSRSRVWLSWLHAPIAAQTPSLARPRLHVTSPFFPIARRLAQLASATDARAVYGLACKSLELRAPWKMARRLISPPLGFLRASAFASATISGGSRRDSCTPRPSRRPSCFCLLGDASLACANLLTLAPAVDYFKASAKLLTMRGC